MSTEEKSGKFLTRPALFTWMMALPIVAGFINVLAIKLFATTVSHVTGLVTNATIAAVEGNDKQFWWILSVIGMFFLGSVIAGFVIKERNFKVRKRYGWILISLAVILFAGVRVFGENESIFVRFLALVCGMENGQIIAYKGIIIRTTHMTGNLTDFGTHVGYMLRGKVREHLLPALIPFLCIVIFSAGGAVGLCLFKAVGMYAFDAASLMYLFLGALFLAYERIVNKSTEG